MAKYVAVCDSYGFQGKHWRKGEIAQVSEKETPPHHFRRLDAPAKEEIVTGGSNDNDLSLLPVKDLKALADEKEIEYPPVIKKADLIALIEKGSGE